MLKGQKIVLTELRHEDSETLFGWINDPETVRFNAPFIPVHAPNHSAWFEAITRDDRRIVFAIRMIGDPAIIGLLQLADMHPVHRSAELIIRIGEEFNRGRGAGSEAVRLATNFAFNDRNLQRVWLRVFADNARAIRAYEKAGLQVEGRLRRACFIDGKWVDEIVMAALADISQ
ncbi:GNAT family N-acetyltransferase [Bradyrhizobium sp. JYMT SZCCT0428]|uniref:GNAT family N-acetyltransferase n=1 Tax=Bradyrhizobium sp. JYMT SZCCT0428 TaxID=2807673 RepID=UPI001BA914A1|nr:GNAT family protein [Bradyrhizobium sp. JYMT SZCCT0428]MBR1156120.1 GNAT family N-acetyltransferase [Bradyrhizobium sp. JYMT SZCCT0428]